MVTVRHLCAPTRRPRAHHRVSPCPGARRQNETEMFSDHDETSPSIAAVLDPSVACSMLAVQQQKRLCRQFVDVSAARRGKMVRCVYECTDQCVGFIWQISRYSVKYQEKI